MILGEVNNQTCLSTVMKLVYTMKLVFIRKMLLTLMTSWV